MIGSHQRYDPVGALHVLSHAPVMEAHRRFFARVKGRGIADKIRIDTANRCPFRWPCGDELTRFVELNKVYAIE